LRSPTYRIFAWIFAWIAAVGICLFLSQGDAGAGEGDREKQLGFAESLYSEGDYYRAITEYKRFNFIYPVDLLVEKSDFRIGECYFKAKRWSEAIDVFKPFILKYPRGSFRDNAIFMRGQAEKQLKRYPDALSTFDELIKSQSLAFSDKARYERAMILVEQEEWLKAREAFATLSEDNPLYPSTVRFSQDLERMDQIPQKSPAVAGTLAAILPGAGHLYTERPRDALVSFLLNGSFIWAAIELFRNNNYVAGGIVTFFEIGWYSGNIYSAVGSAHKFNRRVQDEFIQGLKEKSGLSFYRDQDGANYLMYSMKF
jgi:tetratricopeptide (TPR) repeat protein